MKSRMYSIFVLFFALTLGLFAEGNGRIGTIEGVKPISLSAAEELMKQPNVYVFDVTPSKDREQNGYIHGSVSLDTPKWESLLPADKNATLIFYGLNRFGFEASQAAGLSMTLGYPNSVVMLEGIEGWITSGRVVDKPNIIKWENAEEILEFKDTIHSRLSFGKLPACRDCHAQTQGEIKITSAADRALINQNCATCHSKASQAFEHSVHGMRYVDHEERMKKKREKNSEVKMGCCGDKVVKDVKEKPNCNTCHSIHITPTFSGKYSLKQVADQKCKQCHEKEAKTYEHTFHGKGMALSSVGETSSVASCYDCHGKHNILKSSDRNSTLSLINRVETCKACHPNSTQNFAEFLAHSDYTDSSKNKGLFYTYIFMTTLVISVFLFFGAHTFLWSIRLIAMRIMHPQEWKEARAKAHHDKVIVRRFSTLHRIQHLFMALSFLGLSFSGLPQKFYDSSWAKPMIDLMGGDITNATFIHHLCAVVMFAVFFSHIAEIIIVNWKRRDLVRDPNTGKLSLKKILQALFGPDSLMPNLQDLKDMKNHFKWFFGKGERPQFDRWTYWEKFDYLAVFWGMFVIGFSGLVLWFNTAFAQFLPGWALNVATLVHSDEALLATGFIFAIHFFNTHFRADRFPMDTVIFSGTLSEEEMKQERKVWYERLKASGKLEKLYEYNSKFSSYEWLAKTAGFIMFGTGLVFLFLMLYTFAKIIF